STDQGREERVRDVGDQHPDHAGAAGGQPPGGAVGGVAQLAGGGQDLLTQLALDHLGSREGTRDRRGGDPHGAGDRVDRGPAHGASFRRPVWPCHRPPVRSMANILPHDGPGQLADGPTVPVVPATGRRARLFRSTGPIQNCCSAPPASALRCALSATSVASRLAEVVITGSWPASTASKKYWAGR